MVNRTDNSTCCLMSKKLNDSMMLIILTFVGIVIGFLLGISFPTLSLTKMNFSSSILPSLNTHYVKDEKPKKSSQNGFSSSDAAFHKVSNPKPIGNEWIDLYHLYSAQRSLDLSDIYVPSNPRGAEMLPPSIIESESDFYLRRLWGLPRDDLATVKPKYLVAFTVGYEQRNNIDACVKKFSDNFTIVLFHYDGRTSEYDEFEWSKRAIHVSVPKQTKWWYAKRFLHPDIIAPYDYIFIWDEDLGVENFNAEEYIKIIKKHSLEISQPAIESRKKIPWQITKRIPGIEVHKEAKEKPGRCKDPHLPPCGSFIEIMAPVFSRDSWRCVWHMIQNDLVHGWGLDFALRKCVEPAQEKIGVVDSQWIIHQKIPSLFSQGTAQEGKTAFEGVRERCKLEWTIFQKRMSRAEQKYLKEIASSSSNSTHTSTKNQRRN